MLTVSCEVGGGKRALARFGTRSKVLAARVGGETLPDDLLVCREPCVTK